ncbi:adenosylcobinamide-phosphate synthase CbiB [Stieleria sp. TO1_6]|uniref:adenosylcobinamide-phosphate synthase CbiB n=1 Tax=Stieleria tagensis TaxID=2956795 RepID=UPI00209AA09B|nr:adenosylcobinamide-phosphate synthase CbiB [Stieleria tagensis]MCO8121059.1 adenosylcobinamide-phosphate synthase CbiB [Stieleria tagensis]
MGLFTTIVVIIVAVGIDLVVGEPPNRFHPVAWMGSVIGWARRVCPKRGEWMRFLWGGTIVGVGCVIVGGIGWALDALGEWILGEWVGNRGQVTQVVTWIAVVGGQAVVLKCCFGIRSLDRAARSVLSCLQRQDDAAARQQLGYHLVSRQVDLLSAAEISAATIESVSENTSDSVVAPLFFYVLGGLPAALIYRYVNTCDAMLGYRTTELEWLGKCAARCDDLLNWIPARITAGLIMIASPTSALCAWRTWWQDSRRTTSPNAGHPMSAAAGALGVCLQKSDHYRLGARLREPLSMDIASMLALFARTVTLAVLLACVSKALIGWLVLRGTI